MSNPFTPTFRSVDLPIDVLDFSAPRISREVCAGPGYPCMFCGRAGQDVLWEYDEELRTVFGVSCVDVEACGQVQDARVAYEEGRRSW